MRLLECNNNGDFSLTEFFESDVPKYAILSHRWEANEATFSDFQNGTASKKAGYDKIRFCGEQARLDGLKYFWIDTCCIDKSSSAELAEAINSMFRWYQKATRCYVFLSDVSTGKRKAGSESDTYPTEYTWESVFRASQWFTRGWTLQELLAPSSVEFFSRNRRRLGDKNTLKRHIHEVTGIPVSALEGTPLSRFGVDERLSWAENRQTTRGEDKAYSLMGIFDIHMTLIYGEGRDKAFTRLRNKIDKHIRNSQPEEPQDNTNLNDGLIPNVHLTKTKSTPTPLEDLETKLTALQENYATLAGENSLLKLKLQEASTENAVLLLRTHPHHHPHPSATYPTYPPPNFYSKLPPPHSTHHDISSSNKSPSHRAGTDPQTGERLLAAGAAWDLIVKHPLVVQGLVDVGDVSDRLKGVARCDGEGPMFREREIVDAVEMSVVDGGGGRVDELI